MKQQLFIVSEQYEHVLNSFCEEDAESLCVKARGMHAHITLLPKGITHCHKMNLMSRQGVWIPAGFN
jgi:hypothetical protein